MNFDNLKNPEFQEKIESANTTEQLVSLAKAEGVELMDEQLEAVAGGDWTCDDNYCSAHTQCNDDGPF